MSRSLYISCIFGLGLAAGCVGAQAAPVPAADMAAILRAAADTVIMEHPDSVDVFIDPKSIVFANERGDPTGTAPRATEVNERLGQSARWLVAEVSPLCKRPPVPNSCTSKRGIAIYYLSAPKVTGDTATLNTASTFISHRPEIGSFGGGYTRVTLVRAASGAWRVVKVEWYYTRG